MNFRDWYTDTADVYRVADSEEGALTKKTRVKVASGLPCRVYRSAISGIRMSEDAASIQGNDRLMCAPNADIRPGDELRVRRGREEEAVRYFAGEVQTYYEPFGAVMPGRAHREINLLREART